MKNRLVGFCCSWVEYSIAAAYSICWFVVVVSFVCACFSGVGRSSPLSSCCKMQCAVPLRVKQRIKRNCALPVGLCLGVGLWSRGLNLGSQNLKREANYGFRIQLTYFNQSKKKSKPRSQFRSHCHSYGLSLRVTSFFQPRHLSDRAI